MRCLLLAFTLSVVVPGLAQGQIFLGKTANQWLQQLQTGNEAARRNAAFALGKMGSHAKGAAGALKKTLRGDGNAKVQEAAALALGEIAGQSLEVARDDDVVEALKQALKNANEAVRRSAAIALGHLGTDATPAQQALADALKDDKASVRQNAAWALGKLGPSSVKHLQVALADTDRFVKRDAASALAPMDGEAIRPLLGDLCKLCTEKDSEVRRAALRALVKTVGKKDTAAADFIQQALTDTDLEVKRNAALTLTNIGGKAAVPGLEVLRDALRKGEPEVRRLVAAGIYNIGPEAVVLLDDLISLLRDPDPATRANVALAIGGIGKEAAPAVPALVKMIGDDTESQDARMVAGAALQLIGHVPAAVEAVPALLKILENPKQDPKVREKITWALRVHDKNLGALEGVIPTLTKVVKEDKANTGNKMLRYDCAYLLGYLQKASTPDEALATLNEFLLDGTVEIFDKATVITDVAGNENKGQKANVKNLGKGDGRKMAMDSLNRIGIARVKEFPKIIEQIRNLARDPDREMDPLLKKMCKEYLADNGL